MSRADLAFERDGDLTGSRLILVLLALPFVLMAALTGLAVVLPDSDSEPMPAWMIVPPVGVVVGALILACLGGQVARWASGLLGVAVAGGIGWLVVIVGPAKWFAGRGWFLTLVVLLCVAALGITAAVLAVRGEPRSAGAGSATVGGGKGRLT